MINAEIMRDAEQRRLAWRCRRGMLELDIVLQRFVASQFSDLTLAELEQFDAMLDYPDTEFWGLIQGSSQHTNNAMLSVLAKLQTSRLQVGQGAI
jgi:antitoxin CptB